MQDTAAIIDQVRRLAAQLSPAEKLTAIRAIVEPDGLYEQQESRGDESYLQILAEEVAWYAQPQHERAKYAGEFVAVRGGEIIDHDRDQDSLDLRVRERWGDAPILIVLADWDSPPEYIITSPKTNH